jgi:hypothetical protein
MGNRMLRRLALGSAFALGVWLPSTAEAARRSWGTSVPLRQPIAL